jgi:hypothetical protein
MTTIIHRRSQSRGLGLRAISLGAIVAGLFVLPLTAVRAQDSLPWEKPWDSANTATKPVRAPAAIAAPSRLGSDDPDSAPAPYSQGGFGSSQGYGSSPSYGTTPPNAGSGSDSTGGYGNSAGNTGTAPAPYSTSQGYGAPQGQGYGAPSGYGAPQGRGNDAYQAPRSNGNESYGAPYGAPGQSYESEPAYGERSQRVEPRYDNAPPRYSDEPTPGRNGGGGYYSQNEISQAGHGFFGSVTRGLASAIEYTFKKAGRPNGYILGEDGGGAFIAGLRYGEGNLFTKDVGQHKIYWQGPSLGYDVGAEGSKTMVLVYNMREIQDMYNRFGGIEGSAYLIGGVSVQFQKYGDVSLALIRSGVGLRLGANVGYLKYSHKPTWNPF